MGGIVHGRFEFYMPGHEKRIEKANRKYLEV
jgi:hypothetical protein